MLLLLGLLLCCLPRCKALLHGLQQQQKQQQPSAIMASAMPAASNIQKWWLPQTFIDAKSRRNQVQQQLTLSRSAFAASCAAFSATLACLRGRNITHWRTN
jgi:hypothetical protein